MNFPGEAGFICFFAPTVLLYEKNVQVNDMQLSTILMTAVNAVVPIILMIALGYFLRQKGMLSDAFLQNANKLAFRVCIPSMLLLNVYSIDSLKSIPWDLVLYASAAVVLIFVLGLVTAVLTTPVAARRGVVLQCTFRSNFAIIGMPLAAALGGAEAEAVSAVLSFVTIPLFNILAVVALSLFLPQEGQAHRAGRVFREIVKNPLIQGVAMGVLCLVIRWAETELFGEVVFALNRELKFLYTALTYLKAIATPLALLVLGGQFTFSAVRALRKEITVSVCWRLLLAPLIGIGGAYLMDALGLISCGGAEYPALVALFATPVAVSSAIMAGEMKNDEQLGTQLGVWTSLCSAVSIFVIVCLLMAVGLIGA